MVFHHTELLLGLHSVAPYRQTKGLHCAYNVGTIQETIVSISNTDGLTLLTYLVRLKDLTTVKLSDEGTCKHKDMHIVPPF